MIIYNIKKDKAMNKFQKIYQAVKQIPKGKVCTYGVVANMAGMPNSAKIVGFALHCNPEPIAIPCHRVVNRFGELSNSFAFGGANTQADLLTSEGVEVINNTVNLQKYLYDPTHSFGSTRIK